MCCWYSTDYDHHTAQNAYFAGTVVVGIHFLNHNQWNTNNTSNQYNYSCYWYTVYYGE